MLYWSEICMSVEIFFFLHMAPLKTYVVSHEALIFVLQVFALRAVFEERITPLNRGITVSNRKGCLAEAALFIV